MSNRQPNKDVVAGLWAACYKGLVAEMSEESVEEGPVPFRPKEYEENTIFIYGPFVSDSMASIMRYFGSSNYMTYGVFEEQMARVVPGSEVLLRVNCPGGVIDEASRCRFRLQMHQQEGGRIKSLVEGMDASASTLITQMGDEIQMADMSTMMIHEARFPLEAYGYYNESDIRKLAEKMVGLAKYVRSKNDMMASIYAESTGLSVAESRRMMTAETFMSAQMAVDKGFADSIFAS